MLLKYYIYLSQVRNMPDVTNNSFKHKNFKCTLEGVTMLRCVQTWLWLEDIA